MCGHCTTFKTKNVESLKAGLNKIKNMEYIEIEISNMDATKIKDFVDYPIPTNLSSMVKWFPYILMISSKSWQNGLTSDLNKDQVDTYNPQQGMSSEQILKWVNQTLQKEDYYISNPGPQSYPSAMLINSDGRVNTNQSSLPPIQKPTAYSGPNQYIPHQDSKTFLPTYTSVASRDNYSQPIPTMSKGLENNDISGKIDSPKKPQAHYQINFVPRV